MFKINRKIEYALLALKYMSAKEKGALTSAKEICALYQTPFDPTSRVLQIMTQSKILKAEQGSKGGYSVIKDLSKLSLKDLSKMIIGEIQITNCFTVDDCHCEIACTCEIISPMLNLNDDINQLFSTIMIKDLLKSKHPDEEMIRAREISQIVA